MRNLMKTVAVAATLLAPGAASAVPVLGGQLYATGGNIVVENLPATAGYTSQLRLDSPAFGAIMLNHDPVGTTVNLGSFAAGTELIFSIFVTNTSNTFYMGPASRNPDNMMHAAVDYIGPGVANVGFEDLFGGGDMDYDDNVFQFRGGISTTPVAYVPEPMTLSLLGAGLGGMAWLRRRRG